MAIKVIRSSGNVFRDLGFPPEEAEHLRIRSDLMTALLKVIADRKLTQARAAALFGVSQPRVSDLVRGKIDRFSIDTLVEMLARAGVRIDLVVEPASASRPARRVRFGSGVPRTAARAASSPRSGRSRTGARRRRQNEAS
jgi:predicted XRE-type DNA-binding protein